MKEFLPLSPSLCIRGYRRRPSLSLSPWSCLPRSPPRFDLRYRIRKIVTSLPSSSVRPSTIHRHFSPTMLQVFRFKSGRFLCLGTPFGSYATLTLSLSCSLPVPVKQIRAAKKGDQGRSLSAFSRNICTAPLPLPLSRPKLSQSLIAFVRQRAKAAQRTNGQFFSSLSLSHL